MLPMKPLTDLRLNMVTGKTQYWPFQSDLYSAGYEYEGLWSQSWKNPTPHYRDFWYMNRTFETITTMVKAMNTKFVTVLYNRRTEQGHVLAGVPAWVLYWTIWWNRGDKKPVCHTNRVSEPVSLSIKDNTCNVVCLSTGTDSAENVRDPNEETLNRSNYKYKRMPRYITTSLAACF